MKRTLFLRTLVCLVCLLGISTTFQSCKEKKSFALQYIVEADRYSPATSEAESIAEAIVKVQKAEGLLNKTFMESMDGEGTDTERDALDKQAAKNASMRLGEIDYINAIKKAGITQTTLSKITIYYSFGYPANESATTVTHEVAPIVMEYDLSGF